MAATVALASAALPDPRGSSYVYCDVGTRTALLVTTMVHSLGGG